MKRNNVFCNNCKENDCLVSLDGTCAMIRVYIEVKEEKKENEAE